jgi:hypothetical protein
MIPIVSQLICYTQPPILAHNDSHQSCESTPNYGVIASEMSVAQRITKMYVKKKNGRILVNYACLVISKPFTIHFNNTIYELMSCICCINNLPPLFANENRIFGTEMVRYMLMTSSIRN